MSRDNSNIVEATAAEALGRRIRDLRTQRTLTLDTLAELSGVSRAMLSKIERGENNPTLVVVAKIAVALDLTLSQLIGVEERQQAVKVAKAQQLGFRDPETGFERHIFPAFEGGDVELLRCVVPVGVGSGLIAAHPTPKEKYLLIERGTLRVTVGESHHDLEEGDVLYFRADVPHAYDNIGNASCHFFVIILAQT